LRNDRHVEMPAMKIALPLLVGALGFAAFAAGLVPPAPTVVAQLSTRVEFFSIIVIL